MAPVIWGLDMKEVHWTKFKNSDMWAEGYHLRRTKFIVYQCAVIFSVVGESLATFALGDYIHSQRKVASLDANVYVYNNDFVGPAAFDIPAGVFVSFIFGAAFFFDLFWPIRWESRTVQTAWRICGLLSIAFQLASSLWLTIITARNCGYFEGADREYGESLLSQFTKDGGTPLCYRHNPLIVAAVVFGWLGFVSVVASCILLFLSIRHTNRTVSDGDLTVESNEKFKFGGMDTVRTASTSSTPSDLEKKSYEERNSPKNPQAPPILGSQPPIPFTQPILQSPDGAGDILPPSAHAPLPATAL
ncbi:unnamed protein product [Zymoseptoria tritici ST99CH_3D7]|uniref:MARVEL domain-containing protein n=1 Tax=Zymoseptoria tritici (strain ST99CH_3D7) TaxID=1276538 RepID=A0A1X7RMZ5_ZYMT9|nr:unnamed protein product [Zymoseptoria tritici ST99CH_3D7]